VARGIATVPDDVVVEIVDKGYLPLVCSTLQSTSAIGHTARRT
jgi:hypothetical protein